MYINSIYNTSPYNINNKYKFNALTFEGVNSQAIRKFAAEANVQKVLAVLEEYNPRKQPVKYVAKRTFDYIGATIGLVISAPVIIVSAVIVKLTSKGSAFFIQERIGRNGEIFKIIKLRTMYKGASENATIVNNGIDMRITPVGRILRKYSIDELPQFINVLKGDLHLVGPRAVQPKFVRQAIALDEQNAKRLSLVGLRVMSSKFLKNSCSEEYLKVDNDYVDKWFKSTLSQALLEDLKNMRNIASKVFNGSNM